MSAVVTPLRFVAFGDSVTVGAKATLNTRRWVNVFANQWEELSGRMVQLWNAGVGDNTISPRTTNYVEASKPSALERVHADVIARAPHFVTVAFGLNDLRFGTPVEIFAEDLGFIFDALRAHLPQAQLLALTVPHMSKFQTFPPRDRGSRELTQAYNAAIVQQAAHFAIPIADVSAAMAFKDELVHVDGVHPNDAGQRVIGNRVLEAVLTHLPRLPETV
jgi:lysophospholipase L1-like esterase